MNFATSVACMLNASSAVLILVTVSIIPWGLLVSTLKIIPRNSNLIYLPRKFSQDVLIETIYIQT